MSENASQVIELIDEFLNEEAELLDLRSYQNLRPLAEAVGRDFSSYELGVHLSAVENAPREELLKLLDHYEGNIKVEEAVRARIQEEMGVRSISDVARQALKNRGWYSADEYEIVARHEDEIRSWLVEEEEDKADLIRQVLTMDKKGVVAKVLGNLARESDLNAMRAKKIYGINPA